MHSFAGLIRRTPPPMFSDTAITDRHSDTTSSLGADILVYWIRKIVRTCAPGGSQTLNFLHARRAPYPLGQALRFFEANNAFHNWANIILIIPYLFDCKTGMNPFKITINMLISCVYSAVKCFFSLPKQSLSSKSIL